MYRDQYNVDISVAGRQRLDLCRSTTSISETLSVGRFGPQTVVRSMKEHYDVDDLGEYINTILLELQQGFGTADWKTYSCNLGVLARYI